MTDIPIIFSAPMVRALLEGRKTMTRRLAWREVEAPKLTERSRARLICGRYELPSPWQNARPGDRLWVRASIHMPRWASRLTLVVTATKIERLQEISIDDAWAEGIHRIGPFKEIGGDPTFLKNIAGVEDANRASTNFPCVLQAWHHLWASINGEASWAANPEVVALAFTVHQTNIDKLPQQPASPPAVHPDRHAAEPGRFAPVPAGQPFTDRSEP